jgi:hypothetical protein
VPDLIPNQNCACTKFWFRIKSDRAKARQSKRAKLTWTCRAYILLLGGVFLLLFNLQKRWAEVDSLMEHLDSMGMDVCNVYKGQNVTDDIWDLSIEETKKLFIKHRYIVMVVSDELFLSVSALYYIELARKLHKKGLIKVYVVNNMPHEAYPSRCSWFSDAVAIKNSSNTADEKTYAYAMDIVLGVTSDIFNMES